MTFRTVSELFPTVIARAEMMAGFQSILSRCPNAASRKHLIMIARERGAIEDADAHLLIEAYGLETA